MNAYKFSQDFPTILFGAYDSTFVSEMVEAVLDLSPFGGIFDNKFTVEDNKKL